MNIKYCIADDFGNIVLPPKVLDAFDITSGDTLYLTISKTIVEIYTEQPNNIAGYTCNNGVIDKVILKPNEPYKLCYNADNGMLVCHIVF